MRTARRAVPTDSGSVFRVAGLDSCTITWSSVPGKTYQVLYADSPGSPCQTNLPLSQLTAGDGETSKSYTDATASSQTRRFYKVKLVWP